MACRVADLQRCASLVGAAVLLAACASTPQPASAPAPPVSSGAHQPAGAAAAGRQPADAQALTTGPSASAASSSTVATAALRPLTISPDKGPAGTTFRVNGRGFPPGRQIVLEWMTMDGLYQTKVGTENVQFQGYAHRARRVTLAMVKASEQGQVDASLEAPEDFGEVHGVRAVVDGQPLAQGSFRLMMTADLSPTSGPVGTPIHMTIHGLPWQAFQNTAAIRYDNHYTGFVSAVTTHGTAMFTLRAAGQPGRHVIDLSDAAHALPYLNLGQSPVADFPIDRRWEFTVLPEGRLPPDELQWPEAGALVSLAPTAPRTTGGGQPAALQAHVSLQPASGPVLSPAVLRVTGLPPNGKVDLVWLTATGNRVSPSGWSIVQSPPFSSVTAGSDGSVTTSIKIPDGLGGWHTLDLLRESDKTELGEAPFFVERSLVVVTPRQVHPDDQVTIHTKGAGWTELDNGYAITYDNSYVGFACG
ncbi:MAG: hypothetical protein KGJ86_10355, partial [Chloroflexota bacterium]|nr:hypothetical protein [Chloroflexota bacterium]